MNDKKNILFSEYDMGGLSLRNRVVMAPMTRNQSPGVSQQKKLSLIILDEQKQK